MNVAIVSDSHVPSRATTIPDWALDRMRNADHVIHAGDFDSSKALADVRGVAPRLTAVAGNMDPMSLGLPDVTTVTLGDVEFVVTHGSGSRRNYQQRVASIVADNATQETFVGVSGHTHEVLDETVDGVRLLNPGSVSGASPAQEATMLTVEATDGSLDVAVHRD